MSDWSDKQHGEKMYLSAVQKYELLKSLQIECRPYTPEPEVIKILKQSETDSPDAATLSTWMYIDADAGGKFPAFFFRYQDIDNFYVAFFSWHSGSSDFQFFKLAKKVAGVYTLSSAFHIFLTPDIWEQWKIEFCAAAGTVHAILYKWEASAWVEKTDRGLAGEEFIGGGGIGVGSYTPWGNGTCCAPSLSKMYIDLTKIYY